MSLSLSAKVKAEGRRTLLIPGVTGARGESLRSSSQERRDVLGCWREGVADIG